MSAVTWSDVAAAQMPVATRRGPGRRGHLSLVPAPASTPDGGVHLTRRGRLAVTLAVIGLMLVLASALGGFSTSSAAVSPVTQAGTQVTVEAGQTLSEIAELALPELSTGNAIAAIQVANNLNSSAISAGQTLVIPTR